MKTVEGIGATVEEARAAALAALAAPADGDVELVVLEEGHAGLMGLGAKPARVKAVLRSTPAQEARLMLEEILRHMGAAASVSVEADPGEVRLSVEGDDVEWLVGSRGITVDACQYLLGLAVNRGAPERVRVLLDVGGYRARRAEAVEGLARRAAEEALAAGRPVTLDPMSPPDRRIAHLALADDPAVTTYSSGEEPLRSVVVAPSPGA